MRETTPAEKRLFETVFLCLPNYRPGWSENDGAAQQSRMDHQRGSHTWGRAGENVFVGGGCIVCAHLIAAAIPGPPHLPISLTPFYLGVASAVTLGAFLERRNTGWYAFALALPAIYLDASVAALVWTALTVATFAVIAAIGSRRDILKRRNLLRRRGLPKTPKHTLNQRNCILIVAHRFSRGFALS